MSPNGFPSVFHSRKKLFQVAIDCGVAPPKEGDPSYPLWKKERDAILDSLKRHAKLVADAFNSIEGVSCNPTQGAMYAFPKVINSLKKVPCLPETFISPEITLKSKLERHSTNFDTECTN